MASHADREMPPCPDCRDAAMVDREIGTRTGWHYCKRCGVVFLVNDRGEVLRIVR